MRPLFFSFDDEEIKFIPRRRKQTFEKIQPTKAKSTKNKNG
jgi:hypothetical protein